MNLFSRNKRGFTIIELLVTISLIGFLASVTLSTLNGVKKKGKVADAQQFATQQNRAEGADTVIAFDFEENAGTIAKDSSGFGNNGTINGATWSNDTVRGNHSLYFDGVSAYVIAPYTSSQLYSQKGLTYSVWVKPTAYPYAHNMIMGSYLPYFNIGAGVFNQRLSFGIWASDATGFAPRGMKYANGATVVTLSQWHHVAATYDSAGNMSVYLDGKLDGTGGPYLNPLPIAGRNFYVGMWQVDGSYKFTGYIDEPRYYNHAIDIAGIQKIYAEGKSKHSLAEK